MFEGLKNIVIEQGGRIIAPLLVAHGWANIPEEFRAEACCVTFPAKAELSELAEKSGTEIDDTAIEAWYAQAEAWCVKQEAGRYAVLVTLLDEFCQVGK